MERPLVGHVVTVLFPYTDLSGMKRRPAVVIAMVNKDEYLLCQVTTNIGPLPAGILLSSADSASDGLNKPSLVRCDRLLTAHSSIITKSVGELKLDYFSNIRSKILSLIQS
jgi:mRNA interferase MazF